MPAMNLPPLLALELLLLLWVANGVPVLVAWLLGERWNRPLDGGRTAWDGRPLLGRSKTVRGIVSGVAGTALAAAVLGHGWQLGAVVGAASLAGDLFSSFLKRRLGIESSGQAVGLDQVPEALLPLLVVQGRLGLDGYGILLLVVLFAAAQLAISPVMYRLGIRKRPY
jgi:CDP-2,3-bis-(O-geranylgeranyl)-sn-glycerol synthase